jgi:hypothetical protein
MTFVAALVAIGAAQSASSGGYGPTPPPGPPVPGHYSTVIASETFGSRGGKLLAKAGRTHLLLTIPAGSLDQKLQFTLTRPVLGNLRTKVPKGTVPVTGVAVIVRDPSGHYITGLFSAKPIPLVITDPQIGNHASVLAWDKQQHRFVSFPATIGRHSETVKLRRIEEFVVAEPK